MRAGGATALFRRTKNLPVVQYAGRWASLRTLQHYIQEASAAQVLIKIEVEARALALWLKRHLVFLDKVQSFKRVEVMSISVFPVLSEPSLLSSIFSMMADVQNSSADDLLLQVGRVQVERGRYLVDLPMSEVWRHAREAALQAARSRPNDQARQSRNLLRAYAGCIVAVEELRSVANRYGIQPAALHARCQWLRIGRRWLDNFTGAKVSRYKRQSSPTMSVGALIGPLQSASIFGGGCLPCCCTSRCTGLCW